MSEPDQVPVELPIPGDGSEELTLPKFREWLGSTALEQAKAEEAGSLLTPQTARGFIFAARAYYQGQGGTAPTPENPLTEVIAYAADQGFIEDRNFIAQFPQTFLKTDQLSIDSGLPMAYIITITAILIKEMNVWGELPGAVTSAFTNPLPTPERRSVRLSWPERFLPRQVRIIYSRRPRPSWVMGLFAIGFVVAGVLFFLFFGAATIRVSLGEIARIQKLNAWNERVAQLSLEAAESMAIYNEIERRLAQARKEAAVFPNNNWEYAQRRFLGTEAAFETAARLAHWKLAHLMGLIDRTSWENVQQSSDWKTIQFLRIEDADKLKLPMDKADPAAVKKKADTLIQEATNKVSADAVDQQRILLQARANRLNPVRQPSR